MRREADGVEGAVDPTPALADGVSHGDDVVGVGDVELEHLGRLRELAGGALRQREAATGTGEDHLGALLLGDAGHPEREGGVGQDAGDEDALAVEEGHGPETATSRATVTPPSTARSEEHTSELQSLMRISYAVFCLK